jgi:NAD(P)-dependent dehydrogenase (short-subunit alcohol dehydrogenase family)
MTSLAGKTVLVTGAGSGIGRTAARAFADAGAELVLVGRQAAALRETLPGARVAALDHADDAAVAAFAASCPALDGMMLNAGQFVAGDVAGTDAATFDRMIAANLRGPWLMCHHLGPRLRDGGSIVLVGSNLGIRAIAGAAAYAVAKAGLHMLARVVAVEWARRRIRCNAIAPGPVRTPMLEERLRRSDDPEAMLEQLSRVNPLRRLGREEEVAALTAYLLSDASGWTTGAVIPCDGGATAAF